MSMTAFKYFVGLVSCMGLIAVVPDSSYAADSKVCIAKGGAIMSRSKCKKGETPLTIDHLATLTQKGDVGPQGSQGLQGPKGERGEKGEPGVPGVDGSSTTQCTKREFSFETIITNENRVFKEINALCQPGERAVYIHRKYSEVYSNDFSFCGFSDLDSLTYSTDREDFDYINHSTDGVFYDGYHRRTLIYDSEDDSVDFEAFCLDRNYKGPFPAPITGSYTQNISVSLTCCT